MTRLSPVRKAVREKRTSSSCTFHIPFRRQAPIQNSVQSIDWPINQERKTRSTLAYEYSTSQPPFWIVLTNSVEYALSEVSLTPSQSERL